MEFLFLVASEPIPAKLKQKRRGSSVKPPKRPLTSYIVFMKEESVKFKGMDFKELSSLLASRWKSMTEQQKKPYNEKSGLDKKRYEQEMQEFLRSQEGQEYQQMKKQKSKRAPKPTKSKNVIKAAWLLIS